MVVAVPEGFAGALTPQTPAPSTCTYASLRADDQGYYNERRKGPERSRAWALTPYRVTSTLHHGPEPTPPVPLPWHVHDYSPRSHRHQSNPIAAAGVYVYLPGGSNIIVVPSSPGPAYARLYHEVPLDGGPVPDSARMASRTSTGTESRSTRTASVLVVF